MFSDLSVEASYPGFVGAVLVLIGELLKPIRQMNAVKFTVLNLLEYIQIQIQIQIQLTSKRE